MKRWKGRIFSSSCGGIFWATVVFSVVETECLAFHFSSQPWLALKEVVPPARKRCCASRNKAFPVILIPWLLFSENHSKMSWSMSASLSFLPPQTDVYWAGPDPVVYQRRKETHSWILFLSTSNFRLASEMFFSLAYFMALILNFTVYKEHLTFFPNIFLVGAPFSTGQKCNEMQRLVTEASLGSIS